nr:immunoglobulin light chain junction region [Macaca mulatta]MOY16357.1 immunoglobulin light chain junction region [Macaca mulatta]MOY16368.1 immunoglobulin light chain junction region [Macaca mulatta]
DYYCLLWDSSRNHYIF